MRRTLVLVAVLLLSVSGCGGGGSGRAGGSEFRGTFEVEPGVGPGEISFVLDSSGDRIVSAVIDPGLDQFQCPTGARISGGGISSTFTPGIEIQDDRFEVSGWSGEFDSAMEAHGTYSLQSTYDCPYTLNWTASSE